MATSTEILLADNKRLRIANTTLAAGNTSLRITNNLIKDQLAATQAALAKCRADLATCAIALDECQAGTPVPNVNCVQTETRDDPLWGPHPTDPTLEVRTVTITRVTTTQPSGTGTACKPATEQVVETRPKVVIPPPDPDPPPTSFAWEIEPDQALVVPSIGPAIIATGAAGMTAEVSPDLPTGLSLTNTNGTVTIAAETGAPSDIQGSWLITVKDSELATAQNMRTGVVYGHMQAGARRNIQFAISEAADGDTIQISPGAIWSPDANDGSTYLEAACLHVYKGVTITNIPGQARWSLAPQSIPYVAGRTGLCIREPNQTYSNPGDTDMSNPRKTIVIQGFDFNNWGINGDDTGLRIRSQGGTSWAGYHASITLRDFKLGKLPFYRSASGIAGAAENLIIENGHVYDTGDGVNAAAGNDHNFYISGRNLIMRGVRANRSRSSQYPFSQQNTLDGHILKLTFNNMLIEGCALDCGPEGDNSITIQCKGGGNLIVRSCLLISGKYSQTATGSIVFEKEFNNYGGWMYGVEGHSLLVEKNVFINHRPYLPPGDARAMVYCREPGHVQEVLGITSFIVRDNIGMSTVPDSGWIRNPPPAFADAWSVRNSVVPYSADESGFSQREVLKYLRAAGPIPGGALNTLRFVYPHGSEARSDNHRGLG